MPSPDTEILQWLTDHPDQFRERIGRWLKLDATGCLLWQRSVNTSGYGQVWIPTAKAMRLVHRVVFILFHGSIEETNEIDHTCSVLRCANINHLQSVTSAVNKELAVTRRGEITHCPSGHPYAENTWQPATANGKVVCVVCQRARERSRDEAIKEARRLTGLSWGEYIKRYGRGEKAARKLLGQL